MLRNCLSSRYFLFCKNNVPTVNKENFVHYHFFSTAVTHEKSVSDGKNCLNSVCSSENVADQWKRWWKSKDYQGHPGVCNLPAVSLPDQVAQSAELFLKDFDKATIATVAQKLNNILFSRRVCKKNQTLVKPITKQRKIGVKSLQGGDPLSLVNMSRSEYKDELYQRNTEEKNKNRFAYDWKRIEYDELNAASYLLCRSPACYAVSLRVMNEIKLRVPNFRPKSILDFGSGTGMSIWAANTLWKDSLKQYLCVDSSEAMNNLSFYLFSGGKYDQSLPGIFIRRVLPVSFQSDYDIVISGYSLSELPSEKERLSLLKLLWKKTQRYLILIENGNDYGYYIMMEARNLILNGLEGIYPDSSKVCKDFQNPGHVFAPCPHNLKCPKLNVNSCLFSQKYFRPKYFNRTFQDSYSSPSEKFSYLVLEKGTNSSKGYHNWPRMVSNLQQTPNCVSCHVCSEKGNIEHIFVSKKCYGKNLYYVTKRSKLGDSLPIISPDHKNE